MRRLALILCLAAALSGCGEDDEAPAAATLADLRVTLDADGKGGAAARTTSVRCDAPSDSAVCRAVAKLDVKPPSDAVACTQQYGGPERGRITGTLRGERVDLSYSRTNGCEISRWEAASAVLGAAG